MQKICKLHGELSLNDVIEEKVKWGDGIYRRCRLCKLDKDRKWKKDNKEKHIASSVRWKKNNRAKVNEWQRNDRMLNPDKYYEWGRIGRERLGPLRSIKEVTRIRGINLDQYYQMVGNQDNKCSICNKNETRKNRNGKTARLCIDHNHTTGNVRELLCHNCNQVIGHSKESVEILQKVIEYLNRHNIN